MNTRFSKQAMIEELQRRIALFEESYGFDPHNGWDQVRGKGEEANRHYAKYDTYRLLLQQIQDNNFVTVTK